MGGKGSGSWTIQGRKRLTCECLALDIKDNEKLNLVQGAVQIQETACNYGGSRKWFVCPGEGCGRRARKLYRWQGVWRCRKCHGLAYRSQLCSKSFNSLDRARKLRMRLGEGEPIVMSPMPSKPLQMAQRRYQKITSDIMQAEIKALREMVCLGLEYAQIFDGREKAVKEIQGKVETRLPAEQQSVIELLAQGVQDAEVARVTGVSLDELRIWKNNDPVFIAELNRLRKIHWENSVDQLRGLVPRALAALLEVLNDSANPQRWRAAMEIVKVAGLSPEASHDLGRMIGPDDPREISRRMM
jgi:hypothetical protein